jgi:hypothetical protein
MPLSPLKPNDITSLVPLMKSLLTYLEPMPLDKPYTTLAQALRNLRRELKITLLVLSLSGSTLTPEKEKDT